MQDNRKFKIGDEVYIFQRGYSNWFLEALRNHTFIKGTIISCDFVDYGYHGSGDWIWVYKIKGEDGKIYQGDYARGYNSCSLYTKEDILNKLKDFISDGIYQLNELKKKVNRDNHEYQMLIDKYQDLEETKGRQYKKK